MAENRQNDKIAIQGKLFAVKTILIDSIGGCFILFYIFEYIQPPSLSKGPSFWSTKGSKIGKNDKIAVNELEQKRFIQFY